MAVRVRGSVRGGAEEIRWKVLMLSLVLAACGRVVSGRPSPTPPSGSTPTILPTSTPIVVR
ncbi:MAG: hypothetical protein ACK4OK_03580, partial [Thermoflexus sp.]